MKTINHMETYKPKNYDTIKAIQYTGEFIAGVICSDGSCDNNRSPSPMHHVHENPDAHTVWVEVGDWIIAEEDGEHFTVFPPFVFTRLYEQMKAECFSCTKGYKCLAHRTSGRQIPLDVHTEKYRNPVNAMYEELFNAEFKGTKNTPLLYGVPLLALSRKALAGALTEERKELTRLEKQNSSRQNVIDPANFELLRKT